MKQFTDAEIQAGLANCNSHDVDENIVREILAGIEKYREKEKLATKD